MLSHNRDPRVFSRASGASLQVLEDIVSSKASTFAAPRYVSQNVSNADFRSNMREKYMNLHEV